MHSADRYDLYRLIAIGAYAAYYNSLSGTQSPAQKKYWDRANNLQPGDLVVERSTIWRWARDGVGDKLEYYSAIGVYLRQAMEPYPKVDPDDPDEENPPLERVWYIQPLDQSVPECRWTNADFIYIPTSLEDVR